MKWNFIYLMVVVAFYMMGLATGRHSRQSVEDHKHIGTARARAPVAWVAGALRPAPPAGEQVYLPGLRVCGEEDWSEAVWIPVAAPNEIGPQEQVLAVVVRPSIQETGWVVFESLRAVSLPRDEIARLLQGRFFSGVKGINKLIFTRSNE